MKPEEFRRAGHELVDWIADYRIALERRQLPVRSQVRPGDVARALPVSPPEHPEPFEALLADLDHIVVPGLTHTQHPRQFAWFPANASLSAVLGDLASSGLGAIGLSWQSAPALTEMETVMLDWLRQLTGLSDSWQGVIQDTASTACLVALLVAREKATDFAAERGGLQGEAAALTVYYSEEAHSSVEKAALLAGFGRRNLRPIGTDPVSYAMDPAALERAVEDDLEAGLVPAAVVATVGTTASTAVDPVGEVVGVARRRRMHVHVDAAMAGSALFLPECRSLFAGLEGADSFTWNPHKWLGTVLDTSAFYVREPDTLVRVMSSSPSYLRSAADGSVVQYRDWGIPLGRRFRALKLWFQLRLDGPEAIRARLRRDLQLARRFEEAVGAEPEWKVVAPVNLQTVCVRHEPPGLAGEDLDHHTLSWTDGVNKSGAVHVTPALLGGRWMTRVSIGAEATGWQDLALLWSLMRRAAANRLG